MNVERNLDLHALCLIAVIDLKEKAMYVLMFEQNIVLKLDPRILKFCKEIALNKAF